MFASGTDEYQSKENVGSARHLQGLGFKAFAATSAGCAHSRGLPDGAATPIAKDGTFDSFDGVIGYAGLSRFFREDRE